MVNKNQKLKKEKFARTKYFLWSTKIFLRRNVDHITVTASLLSIIITIFGEIFLWRSIELALWLKIFIAILMPFFCIRLLFGVFFRDDDALIHTTIFCSSLLTLLSEIFLWHSTELWLGLKIVIAIVLPIAFFGVIFYIFYITVILATFIFNKSARQKNRIYRKEKKEQKQYFKCPNCNKKLKRDVDYNVVDTNIGGGRIIREKTPFAYYHCSKCGYRKNISSV